MSEPLKAKKAQHRLRLPAHLYRLNRSKKLEGKPGKYDGRPIVSAVRYCPPLVRLA